MSERPTLPPGILPNIFDTDPPPLHPATVIGDGFVAIDETKLAPAHHDPDAPHHERHERHQSHQREEAPKA